LEKNTIPEKLIDQSTLLRTLLDDATRALLRGTSWVNITSMAISEMPATWKKPLINFWKTKYADLLESGSEQVLQIFEAVFNHKAFTGRSGTFFAYEGLGSIYWHMVSKLALAAQECYVRAVNNKENQGIDQ
jgi:hypothetical protein